MSKAIGPIPPYFNADERGMLCVGGKPADALIAEAGDTPLFVYDAGVIAKRVAELRAAMPEALAIHYAIKANSFAPLLQRMVDLVDGFDVASGGELAMALKAGMEPYEISFAGPGKRDAELEAAIQAGATLNLESENEARRAFVIGDQLGITPRLAVRVNPDFDLKGSGMRMGGGAKPFGIDANRVPALVKEIVATGAVFRGFHIFAGSQALDAGALIETQGATVTLARQLADESGIMPPLVNIGGGFGVPYFAGDKPVDIRKIGESLAENEDFGAMVTDGIAFACELGRWLVAEAGVYLTRIVDRKVSHGETYLICDGGLHHQLAASGNFGTVVRRNYPIAVANRFVAPPAEEVNVVGCLCTPLDRLGDQVDLPIAEVDNLISVFLAGAYGKSASPSAFLGHPEARELIVG